MVHLLEILLNVILAIVEVLPDMPVKSTTTRQKSARLHPCHNYIRKYPVVIFLPAVPLTTYAKATTIVLL